MSKQNPKKPTTTKTVIPSHKGHAEKGGVNPKPTSAKPEVKPPPQSRTTSKK